MLNDKRIIGGWGGATFVDKDSIKVMSPMEKQELVSSFNKECLMAASDAQDVVDFVTDMIYTLKQTPVKVDLTKLQAALAEGSIAPKDTTTLDYTETGQFETTEEV